MRLLFIILLLISTLTSFSQKRRDSVYVKTPYYEVMYSEKLEQPIWLKYSVLCPNGHYSRSGMDFYLNDSVHTSNDLDYQNNFYDKGHLAPAGDFNCDRETLISTFSYLNCVLQNERLNRGVWKSLEDYERDLARYNGNVEVIVSCKYSKYSNKLPTGATAPDGFFKTIKYSGRILKFYFPNRAPASRDFMDYLIN